MILKAKREKNEDEEGDDVRGSPIMSRAILDFFRGESVVRSNDFGLCVCGM